MDLVSLDSPEETEFVASFLNQGLRFRDYSKFYLNIVLLFEELLDE